MFGDFQARGGKAGDFCPFLPRHSFWGRPAALSVAQSPPSPDPAMLEAGTSHPSSSRAASRQWAPAAGPGALASPRQVSAFQASRGHEPSWMSSPAKCSDDGRPPLAPGPTGMRTPSEK